MKKIMIGIILLTAIGMVTGCGKTKVEEKPNNEQESKVNTNEDVIKDQTLEVFEFTNTSLVYHEGMTVLETTVTNTSEETATLNEFRIHVKDKEGNEMETLIGFIGDQLPAKESRVITSYSVLDLSDAYALEYEIVR